jgi:hypothetical protein
MRRSVSCQEDPELKGLQGGVSRTTYGSTTATSSIGKYNLVTAHFRPSPTLANTTQFRKTP